MTIATYVVPTCEDILVQLKIGASHFIVGYIYIPPHSNVDVYQFFCDNCEALENRFKSEKFIIFIMFIRFNGV